MCVDEIINGLIHNNQSSCKGVVLSEVDLLVIRPCEIILHYQIHDCMFKTMHPAETIMCTNIYWPKGSSVGYLGGCRSLVATNAQFNNEYSLANKICSFGKIKIICVNFRLCHRHLGKENIGLNSRAINIKNKHYGDP